jgi:hypothetical protein
METVEGAAEHHSGVLVRLDHVHGRHSPTPSCGSSQKRAHAPLHCCNLTTQKPKITTTDSFVNHKTQFPKNQKTTQPYKVSNPHHVIFASKTSLLAVPNPTEMLLQLWLI